MATLRIAANELPLADELVPFLIARTGKPLDAFARWVVTRRPLAWLFRMLESLPMSTATYEELRYHAFEPTDDPEVRARQRMLLEWCARGRCPRSASGCRRKQAPRSAHGGAQRVQARKLPPRCRG